MRYRIAILIFLFLSVAQTSKAVTKYVFAKEGIKIYQQQDTSSKVVGTLSWGTKVYDSSTAFEYFYRNNSTYFIKVNSPSGTGYVLDMFLVELPTPKKQVNTIDSYLALVTEPVYYIDSSYYNDTIYNGKRSSTDIKTVHKNGFITEYHLSYYQESYTVTLPNIRIQRAYFFYQSLNKDHIFPNGYWFPTKNSTDIQVARYTKRSIEVFKDKNGNTIRLRVTFNGSGLSTVIDFIQLDEHVIIQEASYI